MTRRDFMKGLAGACSLGALVGLLKGGKPAMVTGVDLGAPSGDVSVSTWRTDGSTEWDGITANTSHPYHADSYRPSPMEGTLTAQQTDRLYKALLERREAAIAREINRLS